VAQSCQRNSVLVAQRQARNWSQERFCEQFELQAYELGLRLAITPRQLRRWENGQSIPQPDHRLVLEALFGIPFQQLGFSQHTRAHLAGLEQPHTQAGTVKAMVETAHKAPLDRRDFVVLTGPTLATPILAWLCDPAPFTAALNGHQVTMPMVEDIKQRTAILRRLDDAMGSGSLRNAVNGDLQLVVDLLKNARYTDTVGQSLFSAAGELFGFAGWLSFDSGLHAAAQHYYLAGLRAAHTAGDRALGAMILNWMNLQAVRLGNPTDAIQLSQAAQTSTKDAISPKDAALVAMRLASAYAQAGDQKAQATALNQAFDLFNRRDTHGRSYVYWLNEAHLLCTAGRWCFLPAGQYSQAIKHLRQGLGLLDKAFTRDRAECLSALAIAHVRQNEVEQACATGTQALTLAAQVNSPYYVTDCLHILRRELEPYSAESCVRDFNEQAREAGVAR
jgi:tetratricopeptide (TPR) repeat protein/transcriptional regulator with XRE-family HTH domain